MTATPHQTDMEGFYVSPEVLDRSPRKLYAVLYKPESFACGITHWERGSLDGMTEEWCEIFADPNETAFFAAHGLKLRYPEQIEHYLDEGRVLETTRCWYRRDQDPANKMCPRPAGWTGPWEERI